MTHSTAHRAPLPIVADGEAAPPPCLHVVGAELLELVLDAPRHEVLVARQRAHAPHRIVGEVFLDVREAGDRLALGERLSIRELRVAQQRDAVAEGARDLARLVELDELLVEIARLLEGEHRRLPACHDDRVELGDADLGDRLGLFDERREARGRDKPHADQIAGRVAARIARVAHAVGFALAAGGAEHFDLVPGFVERVVGVGQLGPPEADGPSRGRRGRGVRDDDRDALGLVLVGGVRVSETHVARSFEDGGVLRAPTSGVRRVQTTQSN